MNMNRYKSIILLITISIFSLPNWAQEKEVFEKISTEITDNLKSYEVLYKHLHQNPELSFMEFETSKRMAQELSTLGFEVTTNFGGNSVVGVYKNGKGKTLLLRTDMDALPILEKTGFIFASKVRAKDNTGKELPVMHACGHDVHMTVWVGVANTLVKLKNYWKGTLIMIAQQAEEKSDGANAMIDAGLFIKFPVPDYGLAFHVNPSLESGTVGYCQGAAFAGVNSVDIKIFGIGGHGAYPHTTIDPVVLASRTVLALQTIVSREINPLKSAVVTVGSIHGGTQYNIIPDEVKLQLTLRFYKDEVYYQTVESIKRITRGIAVSAGLPEEKYPEIFIPDQFTPPVYNDPALTNRVADIFRESLGERNVIMVEPTMAGEDFGNYGRTLEKVPVFMFWVGTVSHEDYINNKEKGTSLPPLHSPQFAPDYSKTIITGIKAMSSAAIRLLNGN